jgi:hypothetical protein
MENGNPIQASDFVTRPLKQESRIPAPRKGSARRTPLARIAALYILVLFGVVVVTTLVLLVLSLFRVGGLIAQQIVFLFKALFLEIAALLIILFKSLFK